MTTINDLAQIDAAADADKLMLYSEANSATRAITIANMRTAIANLDTAALTRLAQPDGAALVGYGSSTVGDTLNALPSEFVAKVNTSDLAASGGSALVGWIRNATGAVKRWASDKFADHNSIRDFGAAVDGTTDDTNAINYARGIAASGGAVLYGGKTYSPDFWCNLAPLAQEWIKGLPTAYATDVVSNHPVISGKLFNATPSAGAGYAGYLQRMDVYTKTGVDVASTATAMFGMQSYSTNSSGANFNNTNQVAVVANASAMDAASSASVGGINAIAGSGYSGVLAQNVVGVESDISTTNDAGWYGDGSKAYSVGYSAVLSGSSGGNGTVAFIAGTSSSTKQWWHGAVLTGMLKTGVTVARDGTRTPETGVWVSSAGTYGIYVGAKNKHQLNPASIADYTYKPAVGIALGQEGATSANSHKLRFTATDGSSVEQNWDVYTNSSSTITFSYNGATKLAVSTGGAILVQGTQVVSTRQTGFTAMTGTADKTTPFDPSTVTLVQLAQRVKALQDALTSHGLIGA